jgi:uncharacterized protein (TIGR03435 family)
MMPILLAKVTIVLAAALVAARLAHRSSAAMRHVLLAAAFAVLLALPIASVVAPTIPVAVPVAMQETVAPYGFPEFPSSALPSALPIAPAGAPAPAPRIALSTVLFAVWAILSIAFLLPIVAGLWQVGVLRRTGTPWPEGQSIMDTLAAEARIRRRIDVFLNDAVPGPMTCGVLHPAVLLPTNAQTWTAEDLRRAMIHELEHVRRFDWVTHCFARTLCTCYWFHPLVWMAKRRLILEAERACDDAVLRRSESTAYADQLVGLAEQLSSTSKHPMLAMASPGDLTMRVRAILDQRQRRTRAGLFRLATVMSTAAVFVIAVSSLRMVSQPQAEPAQQTKAEVVPARPEPLAPPPQVPPPATPAATSRLEFSAVSLRPTSLEQYIEKNGNLLGMGLRCRGVDGEFPELISQPPVPQGRCTGTAPVQQLVAAAFTSPLTVQVRMTALPAEMQLGPSQVFYQIEAAAENPFRVTKAELRQMLQTMLRDRFKLQAHFETRQEDGFQLVVAKSGIKFKETLLDEERCCPGRRADPTAPPPQPGGSDPMLVKGRFRMAPFAAFVAGLLMNGPGLPPPMTDKTNLPGVYDITFLLDRIASSGGGRGGGGGTPVGPQFATPIPKALEEQLGLQVEAVKLPVEFLTIDHIEKASEN